MSMFHGVPPEAHGVLFQPVPAFARRTNPRHLRSGARGKTHPAAFYTWEQLRDLWRPGAIAYSSFIDIYGPQGRALMRRLPPWRRNILCSSAGFTFIYLGETDEVGHKYGWMSAEIPGGYRPADAAVARVLEQVEGAACLKARRARDCRSRRAGPQPRF
jgi:hypothetical protein